MIQFTLVFAATECQGWPRIRIGVDGDVLVDHDFTSQTESVCVDIDLLPGQHCLEIERWGKQTTNVHHRDGVILQDQTVTLREIYLDDVKLPEWWTSSGSFYYNDQIIHQGMIWGPNGVYRLPFQTPFVTWILAEKTRRWPDIISLYPPTEPNQTRLRDLLDQFEQDLQRVSV